MSTREHDEVASLLLARARADLSAAHLVAAAADQDDGVIGFHAQQAVEKAIKAVLAKRGREIPRTHDLAYLFELADRTAASVPPDLHDVAWLNPWAVTMRYDEQSSALDRAAAVSASPRAVAWAEGAIAEG